ncbi:hypothetical protein G4228_017762 [Cervus hanglu yarkandensis]|nr:hypothetical protein G4228_017762 [Cervus hanglu yarkandensis]
MGGLCGSVQLSMNFLQSSVETDRQTSPVGGRRVPQITSQAPCLDLQQDAREKPMLRARRVHNSPASLAVDAGSAVPTISRHGLQAPATGNDIRVRGRHCPHGPGLVEWAVQPMAPWRRIDPYGFERPEDFDYAAYEEFFSTYLVILTRRAIKWSKLLKGGGGVQRSMTVKRYIRKGVPLEHRARVWMGVSGAQAQMDRNPGYYQRLLQGERSASLEEAIRTDMSRTFPDNVRFRKDAEPCLQGPLYNVLLAYGHHNHGVGYCQGMNFIAGYLILVTKSEEEAFWLLDALVGRILPADYYSPSMLGLKTDQEVLGELVRLKLPAVAALMDGHGVLWTLVASRWFICLFVDVLPVETVLRVWDCLFSEGSKILFRVALTLLKHHQASILEATSIPDLCEKFKEITRGHFVTECHSFMQRIFSEPGSLSRASIARLRERCRARLLAQG